MSRQWKNFGRAVRLSAFADEGHSCFQEALSADARRERVGEAAAFIERQLAAQAGGLFGTALQDILNAARERFQTPMAQSAFDHCEHALRRGVDAAEAIQEGIAGSLRERARDGCHSIEAYTMQEEGPGAAQDVQRRCNAMLPEFDWNGLAASVCNDGPPPDSDIVDGDRNEEGPPL
jgi:hypothetical protein